MEFDIQMKLIEEPKSATLNFLENIKNWETFRKIDQQLFRMEQIDSELKSIMNSMEEKSNG